MARIDSNKVGRLAMLAAACGMAFPAMTASAQDDLGSRFSVSLGADWVSDYYFRGIYQGSNGEWVIQPYAELGISIYEGDDWTVGAFVGTWSSVHGNTDSAITNSSTGNLYETDFYIGGSIAWRQWEFGAVYTWYTSPNDSFDTVEDIALSIAYADEGFGLVEGLTFSPYIAFVIETGDDQADGGNDQGVYFEFGIEPAYELVSDGDFAGLTISFPVTVGLSVSDYYEADPDGNGVLDDETFGFVKFGPHLSLPLPVPSEWGEWSLAGGVDFLVLGDNTEAFNDPSDEDFEVIGTIGVSLSF